MELVYTRFRVSFVVQVLYVFISHINTLDVSVFSVFFTLRA
jgi:hypothetical protein